MRRYLKWLAWCAVGSTVLLAVTLLAWPDGGLRMSVLDVGQGDAILLTAGFDQVLVDTGPDRSVLVGLGQEMTIFDRELETVVITHAHVDHFEGLAAILERYRVNRVLVSAAAGKSARLEELLAMARRGGSAVEHVAAGESLDIGTAQLRFVWPAADYRAEDENDVSLVSVLELAGEPRAWLMADAGKEIEELILKSGTATPAPILKVGHHGSSRSSGKLWLTAVSPQVAIVSVGKNSFGHPAGLALKRLRLADTDIWRTDEQGTVTVLFGASATLIHGGDCWDVLASRGWCGEKVE